MSADAPRAIVIGAGVAGLACAARLAHRGYAVEVLERHACAGGKVRTLPSDAGPVDAGPTVLTLRSAFEELFADLGERLDDHATLIPQPLIARHFWPDGSKLDLYDDVDRSAGEISNFAGATTARQFRGFCDRTKALFDGLNGAMMQVPSPTLPNLAGHVMRHPSLVGKLSGFQSMASALARQFDDPRLAQLFGRYATYVGGSPYQSPAVLSLIWQAERTGVWTVKGGMHRLAQAMEALATSRGAVFRYESHVKEICVNQGKATGVKLADGTERRAEIVVFNGDPRALATGQLGARCSHVAPQTRRIPRSLSAEVWAFAARVSGHDLAYHNVFFRDDPKPEFEALRKGRPTPDPTLYVCAMDRGSATRPDGEERFEIIANAPPLTVAPDDEEFSACHARTFRTLERFGLRFTPEPGPEALTTPQGFDTLFPATAGSLYGQSPHGLMAAFQRPTARTPVKGLYLAGGGAHPGAGVPMAVLSARHADAAIESDRISTSRSRPTDMPGGMSMGSRRRAGAP